MAKTLTFLETPQRHAFKYAAGNINHFLITSLIGLEGVAAGNVEPSESLRAVWNPRSIPESAKRSRRFVRSATLAWVVQAFEAYLTECLDSSNPFVKESVRQAAVSNQRFYYRAREFASQAAKEPQPETALLELAILWRNRLVHGGPSKKIPGALKGMLHGHAVEIANTHRGLDIDVAIKHADAREPPTLKEVTSLIAGVHNLVQAIDTALLEDADFDDCAEAILASHLTEIKTRSNAYKRIQELWNRTKDDRARAIENILLSHGASDSPGSGARSVSSKWIEVIAELPDSSAAAARFASREKRATA